MNELPKGSIEFAAAIAVAALSLIDAAIGAVFAIIALATLGAYHKIRPESDGGVPITLKNMVQEEAKRKNLEKIIELVRKKGAITNQEVEEELEVSDATAERYLQELEDDGKLEQVGETGRDVAYRLK